MSTSTANDSKDTSATDLWGEYSEWQACAMEVRRNWMSLAGLPDKEIEALCDPRFPANLDEEIEDYNAMIAIQKLNAQIDAN